MTHPQQPQAFAVAPAPVPGPPAGGAGGSSRVILDYQTGARLVEYDLRSFSAEIDAAVQSLSKPRVELMYRPEFRNPFNARTAVMRRTFGLFADAALLAENPEKPVQYVFTGLAVIAQPCTPELQTLMDIANDKFVAAGERKFDRVLVNVYAGKEPGEPRDYISQHGDKGVEGNVVGISAGGCRVFRISRMVPKPGGGLRSETLKDVVALPYHALAMEGQMFQRVLQHGVPQINLRASDFEDGIVPPGADGPRYSFTFRHHVEPAAKRKRGRDSPPAAASGGSA